MRASIRLGGPLGAFVVLLGGCTQMVQSWRLSGYDHDIQSAAGSIEAARDDVQRAAGYTQRGRAYSEKARYSRFFKLISGDEYGRLFNLAAKDHDQAVALNPGSAAVYFDRGQTFYDRGSLEKGKEAKACFDAAAADFKKAVERDGKNFMAWDMLGVAHEQGGQLDEAINDYTQEMALNPLGKTRLADAYCARGGADSKDKRYDAAAADYEKAIEIGGTDDGCSCDPYNPLLVLYDGYGGITPQYDKAWDVVHKAQKSKKWLAPEFLDKLKKDSGGPR